MQLLGRGVEDDTADGATGCRDGAVGLVVREIEVGQVGLRVSFFVLHDNDVFGLDVTMPHVARMRVLHGVGDVEHQAHDRFGIAAIEVVVAQVLPRHEVHDETQGNVGELTHRHHVASSRPFMV